MLLIPLTTNAGIFSFVSSLLGEQVKAEQTEASAVNSQTIPLLRAALSADPNPPKGGGDITVVGGVALLAETGPSGTIADIEERPAVDQISVYVVHEGDSLSGIAKMFGVSVNTIIWANDIKRGIIHEGDTLIILPVSGVRHIVKAGDTVQSIAKKYKGDLNEILQFNDLTETSKLAVGTVVVIPDGEIAAPPAPTQSNPLRGGSGPSYVGYYAKPVIGAVRTQGLHGYNGVDLGATAGTPVIASASGQVIISRDYGWNGGYGNYIVISHGNGTQTLYAHLSQNVAWVGQYVTQGQLIGYVGSTGKSTGPHLHFEVRGAKNPF